MRYTTCIDISEIPTLYRNANVRLVYFHLCLKSGYHDDDRDLFKCSLRRMADDVGISLGALRHALHILQASTLISVDHGVIRVQKFVQERPITKRAKNSADAQQKAAQKARNEAQQALEQEQTRNAQIRRRIQATGKTDFMLYFEGLERRAAQGDIDAQLLVSKHRATYEAHKASMEKK